jgi:hypothetical protein
MSKIKKEDIDLFRRYFLSHNDVVKNGMRQIIPIALLKTLSILEDGLMRSGNMENVAINLGLEELVTELKNLQLDYYISLASRNIKGEKNQEIEELLNNDNKLFKDILNNFKDPLFENDIKNAFKLLERASLKKKFQELELASEISNEELAQAFKLKERAKLKAQFQEIEKKSNLTVAASVVSFNWKRFAIAASVIGVLIASSIFLLNNNKSPIDIASENIDKSKVVLDSQKIKRNNDALQILSNSKLVARTVNKEVLKMQFGFAGAIKSIVFNVYDLNDRINQLQQLNLNVEDSISIEISKEVEVLKSKLNHYNYFNDTISIYLKEKKEVEIISVDNKYFLQIEADIYECTKSKKLTPLKIVKEDAVLHEIKKVLFYSNKQGK